MPRSHVTDHLAQVPLFAACSKKELAHIAKASDEITVPDGHVLTRQDETSREAFVIMSGTAVVKRNGRKVAELGKGAIIGELGLLDRGPRTATVEAQGPVDVLVIGPRVRRPARRRAVADPQVAQVAGQHGPRARQEGLRLT